MHSGQLIEWKKSFWKFSLSTAVTFFCSQTCTITALYITVTRQLPNFSVALYFLQSWPVYNGHLAISQGWPLYTGFNAEQQWFKITTVFNYALPDTLPGKQWIWTESLWLWEIGLHASTYILLLLGFSFSLMTALI